MPPICVWVMLVAIKYVSTQMYHLLMFLKHIIVNTHYLKFPITGALNVPFYNGTNASTHLPYIPLKVDISKRFPSHLNDGM